MKLRYARVSTTSQATDIQQQALKAAGCSTIRTDKASGKIRVGRDELATIHHFLRKGDILHVHKIDRQGHITRGCLNLVHEIHEKGASPQVAELAVETSASMGKVVLTVFGIVSEIELAFIKERQRAGIEVVKAKVVYDGRK